MKPTKRRRTAIKHSDNVETKKLHIDSNRKSVTHLEDLSNEVIYEIFEFLEIYHIDDAFSNLNKRFDNLLTYSTLPIKINISSMSKSTLRQYCQQIINPNKHRITSLRLPNIFTVDILFTRPRIIKKFVRLETLILDNIGAIYFEDFLLYHLASVFTLRSLVVVLVDQVPTKNNLYRSIFRLPVLKYCKLSFRACPNCNSIRIATQNESSSIEHLVIYSDSNLDDLGPILSYVPELRRLSWHKICGLSIKQAGIQRLTLKHLTHVSLELEYMTFDQFEPLIINLFQQLEVLHISTRFDTAYLDSNRWERLISSYMPYLRIFDIEHRASAHTPNDLPLTCMSLNNLFTYPFWCEHQWFFAHQCFCQGNSNQVIFYSTNPYRRKHYTLYGETDKEICFRRQETNLSVVRHVHIQGEKALMSCTNYFPNATELTISHDFSESIDQIINNLNRILPLIQLTKLYIDCGRFCFGKVIHLLQFTPNIDILRVYSMLLYSTDFVSIEKSETFQLVSNTNMIKNFTVERDCRFEQMKLLVNLCPRLQHINMDIYWRDFSLIFELLFSNMNNNPGHLFSICLKQGSRSTIQKLLNLSKSKKWLDKYSIKLIDKKLYLWW